MGFPFTAVAVWLASFSLLAIAAATDLRDRRIPDQVSAAVAAVGLAQGLLMSPGSVWLSLVVAAIVFAGLAVLSHHQIIGGGDVKLVTAVTLLVPPGEVGRLVVDIALAGGVLSCVYLSARLGLRAEAAPAAAPAGRRTGALSLAMNTQRRRIAAGGPMPYALAILGGACLFAANGIASCSSALSCSP